MTVHAVEDTRAKILHAALEVISGNGYQGASLKAIVDRAGITKGALFHHFESKQILGYTVVDEILHGMVRDIWLTPIADSTDPIADFKGLFANILKMIEDRPEILLVGCPLNNLAQEMSPIDEGFRERIEAVYDDWRKVVMRVFERGITTGNVRQDVRPDAVAAFLVATFAGMIGTAKNAQSITIVRLSLAACAGYLDSLTPH